MAPSLCNTTLPMQVLDLIFARLPSRDIIRLQCLSKEWNRNVKELEFRRACAFPKMFALMLDAQWIVGSFPIWLYDTESKGWHYLEYCREGAYMSEVCSSDGGLVCKISTKKDVEESLEIIVHNPLTREWKVLPSHPLNSSTPRMVELVVDPGTNYYEVRVVDPKNPSGGGIAAQIYNSRTGAWSSTTSLSNRIFGLEYIWTRYSDGFIPDIPLHGQLSGLCVYKCADGKFLNLIDSSRPWYGIPIISLTYVKDRVYVLHNEIYEEPKLGGVQQFKGYCISEYQGYKDEGLKGEPNWIKLRVYRCDFQGVYYNFRLHVCQDLFFLVIACNRETRCFDQWFYDMSTSEWQALSILLIKDFQYRWFRMCELQWGAVP